MYKSVVWTGGERLEVMEKPVPKPGPGKVLLKIKAAGICGTDLHILSGKHPQARPPLVLGHEFAGEVVDTGPGVDKNLIGVRVGSDSYVGCNKCKYCLSGRSQLCEKGTCELGINIDGGWAEYVVVPVENLYILPENVYFSDAGAGCILNCPMAAIERVKVKPGDFVLIIGDGPSSLIMIQLALIKGASKVIVAGHRERRLSVASELGASQTINTHLKDINESIKSLPREPHVVIDAVGTSETFTMALALAGRDSRVHLFGLPEGPLNNIPIDNLLWKELVLTGSTGVPSLWRTAMDLLSRGSLKVAPIVSHRFSIEDAPGALDFVRSNPGEVIKALFEMKG